ncbi:ATP-NAD kinase-like domain-containing protein, partial [Cladochytrium replicatum]
MIVAKVFEANIISFTRQVACYLVDQPRLCHTSSEGLKIYVDAKIKNHPAFNYTRLIATNPHYAGRILFWDPQFCATNADLIDFVVTLGGDGTVLFTSWLFQQTQVPPVIPFHLGSLGFLTNFNVVHIRDVLERVIGCRGNGVRVNMRMRLQCTVWRQGGPIVPPSVRTNQKDAIVPNFAISDTSEGEFDDSDDMLFFHTRNTSEGLHATPIYRKTSVPGIVIAEDETPLFASSINSPVVADIDTVLNAITSSLPCKADFSYDDEEPAAGSSESHTEIGKDTGMRAGIDSRARKPVPAESFHILNDLVVDRGPSAYMSQLELYVDDRHLTTVQADGLVVSTPTGSTAYSLSAGGSLVHPECPAILVTPICPHTLSFRPFLLPDGADLKIQVPIDSRSTAWASFDGRHRTELKQGDFITVTMSRHPLPTLCQEDQSSDWFESLRRCLHWNERARQR